ncbi:MAG: class I SAM-dependent methyltransferase [Pseudobdellovibrio sp.]
MSTAPKALPFDKYKLYNSAVQSPETDVLFYQERYKEFFGKPKAGLTLREDFSGGGAISCEWVKLNRTYRSCGIDLDEEPMQYGREHYISQLSKNQKGRVALIQKNVLDKGLPRADISVAVNFSYFIFKKRSMLQDYFKNVYQYLNHSGLFIVDIFGGTQCTGESTDRTPLKGFTYYWQQKGFDPVTNEAQFAINFKYKNKMYKDVFTYDWRMWTIPEIKELMVNAGFDDVHVYWEGTARNGMGNGKFTRVTEGEACLSWIAYIIGVKK